jgi:hypothetical protein
MTQPAQTVVDTTSLREAIETFIAYIESFPAEALAPTSTAEWGPREVLCHLVFWHEENADTLDALLKGNRRSLRAGGVHQNNAEAVALNRDESIGSLCERWRAAQRRIEALLAGDIPTGLRMAPRQGATDRPLEEFFRPGHVLGHLRQLQRHH